MYIRRLILLLYLPVKYKQSFGYLSNFFFYCFSKRPVSLLAVVTLWILLWLLDLEIVQCSRLRAAILILNKLDMMW